MGFVGGGDISNPPLKIVQEVVGPFFNIISVWSLINIDDILDLAGVQLQSAYPYNSQQ